jgi:hypothetical protein
MKRNWFMGLVVVLGAVLIFAGCQKKATFVGTWSATQVTLDKLGAPSGSSFIAEFTKDNKFSLIALSGGEIDENDEGTYSVDKDDSNTARLTFDNTTQTLEAYLVDNQLVLTANGESLVFDRAGESSNASFNNIDDFLKQYEKVIVSIEKAAKSKKTQDVLKLSTEATMLYSKAQPIIADSSKWTPAQLAKLTALAQRAAAAAQNMY